jgi:acylphosphatase
MACHFNGGVMSQQCIRATISGKVQGVWFRAFTREQALKLGITGWANNLADGRVEVMLCGDESKLQALIKMLDEGPPLAKVSGIQQHILDWKALPGFTTG